MPTTKTGKPLDGKLGEDPADQAGGQLVPLSTDEVRAMVLGGVSGVARDITEQMLGAEDIDALLGSTEPTEALVGITFRLKTWKWVRSQIKAQGSGVFAVLDVVDLSGKSRIVTTGAQNILAALLWFQDHTQSADEVPPLTVRSSETEAGNTVYRLVKAPGA